MHRWVHVILWSERGMRSQLQGEFRQKWLVVIIRCLYHENDH
jgi:hypothetical protein